MRSPTKPLVVLPTYNERENLPTLVEEVLAQAPAVDVLVVDDNSPDGTGAWVAQHSSHGQRVHLLARASKLGLGTAYRAGWVWGLERGYDPIVTMDADGSHAARYLPALLALVDGGADVAIGARYIPGGSVLNWPLHRRVLSRGANFVARNLLGLVARDVTSGFRAYRARARSALAIPPLPPPGGAVRGAPRWRAQRAGLRCAATPIRFENRRHGKSKISHGEVYRAVATLARLRFSRWRPAAGVVQQAYGFDYGSIPPGYYDIAVREARGVQATWHRLEFALVGSMLDGATSVLDVGCGPGTFLGTLDASRRCLGLDVADAQIAYAREHYGTDQKSFETFAGAALPVPDASWHAVTMIQVVEHLDDPLPALREAVRALRPGGRLVVTTPNYSSHWPILEWLVGKLSPVDYTHQHVSKFNRRRLRAALEGAGLVDVRVTAFMRVAPFVAALSSRLADAVNAVESRVAVLPGALILGTGRRPE